MYNLHNVSELYYTNNSFYSSYPFPEAWIKVFTENKDKLVTINEMKYEPIIDPKRVLSSKCVRRKVYLRASSIPKETIGPSIPSSTVSSKHASVNKSRCKILLPNKEKMMKTLMIELGNPSTLSRRILRSVDRRHGDRRGNLIDNRIKRTLDSVDISNDIINYLDTHRISFDTSQGSNTKRHSTTSNNINRT